MVLSPERIRITHEPLVYVWALAQGRQAGRAKNGPVTAGNENPIQGKTTGHGHNPVEGTSFVGINGALTVLGGGEISAGFFYDEPTDSWGFYYSQSQGAGLDISVSANVGFVPEFSDFVGESFVLTEAIPVIGSSQIFDSSGNLIGAMGSVGVGPVPGALSFMNSNTITWSPNPDLRYSLPPIERSLPVKRGR